LIPTYDRLNTLTQRQKRCFALWALEQRSLGRPLCQHLRIVL